MNNTSPVRFDLEEHKKRTERHGANESQQLARLLWLNSLFGSVNGEENESDDHLEPLVARMSEYTLAAGTLLFAAGEQAAALYFVQSGEIQFGETGYRRFTSGDVLGFIDCALGQAHEADAMVVQEAKILVLTRIDWLAHLAVNPVAVRNLIRAGIPTLSVAPHPLDLPVASPSPSLSRESKPVRETSAQFVQRLLALRSLPLFEKSGVQALSQLVRGAKKVYLEKEQEFIPPVNEPLLCILITGHCNVCLSVSEQQASEYEFRAVQLIGSLAGFFSGFSEFHLQAQGDAELLVIDTKDLLDIAEDHFDLTLSLVAYSARRIKEVMQAGGIDQHVEERVRENQLAKEIRDKKQVVENTVNKKGVKQ